MMHQCGTYIDIFNYVVPCKCSGILHQKKIICCHSIQVQDFVLWLPYGLIQSYQFLRSTFGLRESAFGKAT